MVFLAPRWFTMVLAPPFRILLFSFALAPPSNANWAQRKTEVW
jgi:hypothetical protein